MPYGRGGAGNLQQQQQPASAQTHSTETRDIEANRTGGPDAEEEMARAEAQARARREVDPFAHTGRGGAGNWFSPRDLASSGTFVNTAADAAAAASTSSATATATADGSAIAGPTTGPLGGVRTTPIAGGAASESRRMGRGGAGNYVWETERERQMAAERREQEAAISSNILKDVEVGLAKPGRAVLKHETAK